MFIIIDSLLKLVGEYNMGAVINLRSTILTKDWI